MKRTGYTLFLLWKKLRSLSLIHISAIFGKGDFFILRASGQSMIEAGIDDGDLVVVKKQVEANDGDIVVALVDNQNTLKRYFRDDENKKIILHPENKKMNCLLYTSRCV